MDGQKKFTQGPGWFPGTPRLGDLSFVPEVSFAFQRIPYFGIVFGIVSLQAMSSDSYSHINNFVFRIRYVRNTTQSTQACSTCTRLPIFSWLLLPPRPWCRAMQGSARQPGTWYWVFPFFHIKPNYELRQASCQIDPPSQPFGDWISVVDTDQLWSSL